MRIRGIIKAYNVDMITCWGACLRVILHSGLGSQSVYISTAKSVRCCLLTRFHIVLGGIQQRTVGHGAVVRIADLGAAAGILIPRSVSFLELHDQILTGKNLLIHIFKLYLLLFRSSTWRKGH